MNKGEDSSSLAFQNGCKTCEFLLNPAIAAHSAAVRVHIPTAAHVAAGAIVKGLRAARRPTRLRTVRAASSSALAPPRLSLGRPGRGSYSQIGCQLRRNLRLIVCDQTTVRAVCLFVVSRCSECNGCLDDIFMHGDQGRPRAQPRLE